MPALCSIIDIIFIFQGCLLSLKDSLEQKAFSVSLAETWETYKALSPNTSKHILIFTLILFSSSSEISHFFSWLTLQLWGWCYSFLTYLRPCVIEYVFSSQNFIKCLLNTYDTVGEYYRAALCNINASWSRLLGRSEICVEIWIMRSIRYPHSSRKALK